MLHLVTLPGGTAPKAQVIGYSVGGKSGTAYKQEGASYATKKYRAWFVGMAPIQHPRIIVAVMVDEPTAASTSAATSPRRCSARSCSRRCA
jgi:cell division protein FtsI (penicillin-binding protein 3)